MNPELETLFARAVTLTGIERKNFLDQNCTDPAIRRELELLIEHDRDAEASLCGAVSDEVRLALRVSTLAPGERLGSYSVIAAIGSGGMGLVYLGERADGSFEQQVAIKVLHGGLESQDLATRIQRECRILASLEHPNIARLLDAGFTNESLPYFVMEYVDGRPIDIYCDEHLLGVHERLMIMLPVCDAVHLAHQKLIVHRDLKPDNILVTPKGVPKLLDFGIAKVLGEGRDASQNTGTCALTPEYACPEQARGEPVTTASDVYSLGGVLYRLLTGSAPHQLQGKSPVEALHAICEQDVPPASKLRPELSGDIEQILQMALRKSPDQRYRSAHELAADIRNVLEQKPVIARPDTLWYRSSKYIRRHLLAVAMGAAMLLLLASFALLEGVQLRQTLRERDRVTRIADFLTSIFQVSDPSQARGNSVSAREILDKAVNSLDQRMAKDPEQQAQMMHVMGRVYSNLGLYHQAELLLKRSLDIRRRTVGPEHKDTLETAIELSHAIGRQGRLPEEQQLQRQIVDICTRTLGADNPETINAMGMLSNSLSAGGHLAEADKLAREVLDRRRRLQGPDNLATLQSLQFLGLILEREGKSTEAERIDRQVLDFRRRSQGADHPDVLAAEARLGSVLVHQGNLAEAEPLLREAVENGRHVLGPDHPFETSYQSMLAGLLAQEGRYTDAESLHQEVLEARLRVQGPQNSATLNAMANVAGDLNSEGRYDEAEKLLLQTIDVSGRTIGAAHPLRLWAIAQLGLALDGKGQYIEAEKRERESLDGMSHVLGAEQPDTLDTTLNLAVILMHQRRYSEAEQLASRVHEISRRVLGPHHPGTAAATYALACISARTGHPNEAFSRLEESIDNGLAPYLDVKIARSPDFLPLHSDPRWNPLLAKAQERAVIVNKSH